MMSVAGRRHTPTPTPFLMHVRRLGLFLLQALLVFPLLSQPLAFPGAAGFGKHAKGARGGSDPDVYVVTSLADNGAQGSLRHAVDSVSGDNGRFIVFAVGGVIVLDEGEPLDINSPYITIAGQTAPNGGICIIGEGVNVNSHDIIIRGLRVRPSDYHSADDNPTRSRDGMKIGEGTASPPTIRDIIIDHCSFSWSTDEIASAYRACANVTYQYSIFAEPLHDSIQWDEGASGSPPPLPYENVPHGMGPTFGPLAKNISFYRNVTAHAYVRNPSVKETDQMEVINNIFYNYTIRGVQLFDNSGNQALKANVISNMWLSGPSSASGKNRVFHFRQAKASNNTEIYLSGNVAHVGNDHLAFDDDPVAAGFTQAESGSVLSEALKSSPVFSGISTAEIVSFTAAEDELDFLLAEAGARWPMRDAIDSRVIGHIENGNGAHVDVVYLDPGTTPGQWLNEVGDNEAPDVDSSGDPKLPDYATLGSGAPTDSDSDGIPDALESTYGSDPLADDDSDGYLNIEEYINGIIDAGSGGDTTAPSVAITSPADEATVSGTIAVTATAADNVGVVGVQFKLDGSNLGAEDTTSPYSVSWDTSATSVGSHVLTAVARDAANNTTTSTTVDVIIGSGGGSASLDAAHDSFVQQGSPTANFNSTGTIYVKNANTSSAFHRVGFLRFDGSGLASAVSSGTLTLTIVDNGQGSGTTVDHSLYLVGTDAWNETTLTWSNRPTLGSLVDTGSITATVGQSITFTLNQAAFDQINNDGYLSVAVVSEDDDVSIEYGDKNDGADAPSLDLVLAGDTTDPTVAITSPSDEADVTGILSVTAGASDDVGVVGVQFKLDGINLGSEDTTAPYSVSWDTSTAATGSHTLTAVARDAANNTTTSSPVDVTVVTGTTNESLGAAHDSFVRQGDPSTNFNSTGTIYVKNSDPGGSNASFYRVGYLRFDASNLTGTTSSGTLTLTVVDNGQGSGTTIDHSLHLVSTDSWDETTLTWSNRPTVGTRIDTESITATIGQSITFTLSQAALDQVNNDGYLSVAVVSEDDDVTIEYGDRNDGSDAPTLDLVVAAGSSAPAVTITNPGHGSTVSGIVTVNASAFDDVGVEGVQFKLDGSNLGPEDTSAPFRVSWDSTATSVGSHALTAVARDGDSNTTTSTAVTVTVASPSSAVVDTFETGNAVDWTSDASGVWSVMADGTQVYRQTLDSVSANRAVLAGTDWTDQWVEADVKPISHDGSNRFYGVVARYADASNYYYLILRTNNTVELKKLVGGSATTLDTAGFASSTGNWYTLRLEVVGTSLKGFVNGQLLVEATDAEFDEGSAALLTFFTEASFDDVIASPNVSSLTPFGDDFEDDDANGWSETSGTWSVVTDGTKVYSQSNTAGDGRSAIAGGNWSDQIVEADVKATSFGSGGTIGVMGRYQDTGNHYAVVLNGDNDTVALVKVVDGTASTLATASFTVAPSTWYDVRLKILDTTIKVYLDGALVVATTDSALGDGSAGLVSSSASLRGDEVLISVP